jgi:HPt (histidine-containing phosphotransfer) domain-containing protein
VTRLTEAQRAQLEALRESYRAELPAKLGLIESTVEALRAGGERSHLQALYDLIHKLTGSAAIYGFRDISRAAGDLESWALQALDDGLNEARRLELTPLMSALRQAFSTTEIRRGGSRSSR